MACVVWRSDVQMALKACIMAAITLSPSMQLKWVRLSDRCAHWSEPGVESSQLERQPHSVRGLTSNYWHTHTFRCDNSTDRCLLLLVGKIKDPDSLTFDTKPHWEIRQTSLNEHLFYFPCYLTCTHNLPLRAFLPQLAHCIVPGWFCIIS